MRGGQHNFDLDNDGTCLESTIEDLVPEELRMENSTLCLNSRIEELKQHVYGLEVLNRAMKKQHTDPKQAHTKLVGEVKEKKRQVKIWKYWASKCYEHLKMVAKKLKKV